MSNAPGRVLTLLKQQAADLTHHHWAQVRWRNTIVQNGSALAEKGSLFEMLHEDGFATASAGSAG